MFVVESPLSELVNWTIDQIQFAALQARTSTIEPPHEPVARRRYRAGMDTTAGKVLVLYR